MHRIWILLSLAAALICTQPVSALQTDLVGLDKNNSTNWGPNSAWVGQNLQDWKELDYIPVRIELTGESVTNQLLTFTFDHAFGFQNLYFISNSPNVLFDSPPMLIAPFGAAVWTYNLRITKTDEQIGYVYFYARLAAGAHINPGSSLHLDGPTFEPLQIHKPGAGTGNPNCAISKSGPSSAAPGTIITYTLTYTNKGGAGITAASGVQVTDELPPLLTYVPGSASSGGTIAGNVITWDVLDLPVGGSGTFTFQAVVASNAASGQRITNSAAILCADDDASMLDNFAIFITTVTDTPVIINCSANKTVELGTVWNFDPPTASGGCGAPVTIEIVSTTTNAIGGACSNSFTATRTWRATDICGNSAECSQTVTVVDTTVPVITCSANKIVELGSAWTFDEPTATDIGGGAVTITVIGTTTNRTEANCGVTFTATRTWQATDACGATAQCSQTVTVEDHTGPTIVCAGNKTVELGSAWNFDPPTASDPSGVTVTILDTTTNRVGFCGNTFQATRTWHATDGCGNNSQCSQTVTVIDTTGPNIVCAANKTVEFGSAWAFDPPTATDLSGTNITIAIVSTTTNTTQTSCGNTFTATRTWRATDACGNPAQCSQTVTVVDSTMPIVNCSTNKTVEMGVPWTFDPPTATDIGGNATITIVSTTTNQIESCGNTFTATRVWAITDMCSNTVQCTQVVTVRDGVGPTVTIIIPTNNTVFLAPATFTIVAEVGDSNGIASVTFLANSTVLGTSSNSPYFAIAVNLPAGDYALRAVASDLCGLVATSAVVNVHVISNPPIIALGPIVLNRQNGLFEQSVRVTNPTPFAWPNGLRIYISNLDPTNRVWNANGTNNGLPYVEKTNFVAAGGSQDFLIQYYVPNPRVTPTNTLTAVPNPTAVGLGSALRVEQPLPLTNGQFCVEFLSKNGRLYYIQRTEDHLHWTTVGGLIVGTGQRIQQFDGGAGNKRFYRVVSLP